MTFKLAHLSDPHFGTTTEKKEKSLLETLHDLRPDCIVLSGDITQRARSGQFKAARRFVDRLPKVPIQVTPGNHDIPLINLPSRLLAPYRAFQKAFPGPLDTEMTLGPVQLVTFNSTSRWRHIQGAFGRMYLHRRLQKLVHPSQFRIVCFHHPLDVKNPVDEKNLLLDDANTAQELSEAGADLVLGGHIHDPWISLTSRRHSHVRRPFIISVAGTCLSHRTRKGAPNSFHWFEVELAETVKMRADRLDLLPNGRFATVEQCFYIREKDFGWKTLDPVSELPRISGLLPGTSASSA